MWDSLKNLHEKFHESIEEMQKLRGLRIWIIHVLDEGPKNGVEIMDSIQEHHENMEKMRNMQRMDRMHRMDGRQQYKRHSHRQEHLHKTMHHASRPSPGSVYPLLKKMVDENLISKNEDGRYELTSKGQEISNKIFGHLKTHGKRMDRSEYAVKSALTEIDSYISYLEDIKKEKLIPHEELMENLAERLINLKESFYKD